MIKLALSDILHIHVVEGKGISIRVPNFPQLENESNLAVRAAQVFLDRAKLFRKIEIKLDKNIPIAGGLGGGSSDAATVLVALNREFKALSFPELLQIGASLGADIPFFIQGSSIAFATGIGDELFTWPSLPKRPVVLVNPGFGVVTREVYENLGRSLTWEGSKDTPHSFSPGPKSWEDAAKFLPIGNDLEAGVEEKYPAIGEIRRQLVELGAGWARMSGSGGTVFGLFDDSAVAKDAAMELARRWPVWTTETLEIPHSGYSIQNTVF